MTKSTNDNDTAHVEALFRGPDAHGQAAMLLVESLIHALIARSVISVGEAIEIVDVAADVKREIAADLGDSPATMSKSLSLLASISASLKQDVQDR
jgi:hypothetical protein